MRINKLTVSIFIFLLISGFAFSQSGNDTIVVPYEEININCFKKDYGNNLITNESDYKDLLRYKSDIDELPQIDFEKYSLITILTGAGGCSKPNYNFEIKKFGNKYFAKIEILEEGICRLMFTIRYFCLIPKVESDDEIEFIKIRKKNSNNF